MPLPTAINYIVILFATICVVALCLRRTMNLRISPAIITLLLLTSIISWIRTDLVRIFSINVKTASIGIRGIYVYNAYRISDEEVRFYFHQSAENTDDNLIYKNGEDWQSVTTQCVCPLSTIVSQCSIEAHLGIAQIDNVTNILRLTTSRGSEEQSIDIIDVRPSSSRILPYYKYQYPHLLGVCIQPIYYYADWTVLIQFFEFWIASGVTKFYIYEHSVTPQVKTILSYYSSLLGDNVTMIPWSDLPVREMDRGNFFTDPNTRMFRGGAYAAINDCLLRARWEVKYVAMLDIDEILHTDIDIITKLEEIADSNPDAGTFAFDWKYVQYQTYPRHIQRPGELNFDSMKRIELTLNQYVIKDYARLKKIIQRPERVKMTDIHNTLINEAVPLSPFFTEEILRPISYPEVFINGSQMSVLHLRRFNPVSIRNTKKANATVFSHVLTPTAEKMNRNFLTRRDLHNVSMGLWWNVHDQTMRDLEQCRLQPFNTNMIIGKGFCRSLTNCEPTLRNRDAFTKVQQVWSDIGGRAKFVKYVTHG